MKKVQLLSLKNQKAFDFVSRNSVRYSCRYFSIIFSSSNIKTAVITRKPIIDCSCSVFYGFKVSKKIGKAHERNLLKRRLKNIYLKFFQQNFNAASIIFIPKVQVKTLDFASLELEIIKAINWCFRNEAASRQ